MQSLLQVRDLQTYYFTPGGVVRSVDGVNLEIQAGETLGLVGESGCGKTTLGLSLIGLVPPPGRVVGGQILFRGQDLVQHDERAWQQLRGRHVAMVLQDPTASVNPVLSIGYQVGEPLHQHLHLSGGRLRSGVIDLLGRVRISSPERRLREYAHRFSGGMRQRAVTAMALAAHPELLIADEPTTALDVTIQAQMLRLFRELQREQAFAMLLITHDLGIVAELCERVAIMYAGQIVETGQTRRLLERPSHPYTASLLRAVPRLGRRTERLESIEGQPPDLRHPITGCRFAPRCPSVLSVCRTQAPPVTQPEQDGSVACWLHVPQSAWPLSPEVA
ncbi:MAG: ABC transporter ATP-binding protein [Chloroflexota bacterium]